MFQKYKKVILIAVAIILLFVVYTMFFKKEEEPVLSTTSGVQGLSAENNELISLLSELRSITLEKDIFNNSVFRSLFDFSVILIPEPVSRPNPFAPIGSEGAVPQVQNQTQIDIGAGM